MYQAYVELSKIVFARKYSLLKTMKGFPTKNKTEGGGGHGRGRILTVTKKRMLKKIETEWLLFIVTETEYKTFRTCIRFA
jgi:hypothetical protein